MIVEMKRVSIVMRTHEKNELLRKLRKIGIIHLDEVNVSTSKIEDLDSQSIELNRVLATLKEIENNQAKKTKKNKNNSYSIVDEETFSSLHKRLSWLISSVEEKEDILQSLKKDIDFLTPFGQISLDDLAFLKEYGYPLHLYSVENESLKDITTEFIKIKSDKKFTLVATIKNTIDEREPIYLPSYSLEDSKQMLKKIKGELTEINSELIENISHIASYIHYLEVLESEKVFEKVSSSMDEEEGIITWLSGYLPVTKKDIFTEFALTNHLGYALSEIREDENPPSLVSNNKVVRIISPVFDILGTVPGYREYDISMWFLMFFALFFAMIVGDGAYGLIFLIGAITLHIKTKKSTNAVILLYVLSITSIIWGAVTGTWFGSYTIISSVPFLQSLVIPNISSYPELFGLPVTTAQNTVMQFCFIIGTVQLSLACVMNIHHKIGTKDISAVADVGWLMMIDALYFLVLSLVIGSSMNASVIAYIVGIGFLLVVVFGAQGPGISFLKGLAGGAANLFTTFLNSISAFSNIISYIRLFAVGMASLAIAQSFNTMADGFLSGFALPAGIIILVFGHGLNIAMALLSVVVHGVRLNLLEFSGQLGMEWTGYQYNPFRETVKHTSHTL